MAEIITFTDTSGLHLDYTPKPASQFIPDWYKKMNNYINDTGVPDENGATGTIKKCMPVFDSLSIGYIITTYVDIWVKYIPNQPSYYSWPNFNPVQFHPNAQANTHFSGHKHDFPKFANPWAIKTPKGYSCLFVPPMNRPNIMLIIPGVVDTDKYTLNVEFPFMLSDEKFDGLIPAGTPIAQIIPFKRNTWKHNFGGENELQESKKIKNSLRSHFYHVYKNKYRTVKEYK